jgi:hypothetical protein
LFIGNPVSGANVDVIETKHEGKVVGWGSNGGNNQQWYAEALPESYQAVVDQSDPPLIAATPDPKAGMGVSPVSIVILINIIKIDSRGS